MIMLWVNIEKLEREINNVFVSWKSLNGRHPYTAICTLIWGRKHKFMSVEETQEGEALAVFHAYGCPFSAVSSYKHLGNMILASNDDWVAVILNPGEVRKR